MGKTILNQEKRLMVFEDACSMWTERRLTQREGARLLGGCERTFRRWAERHGEDGIEGVRDRRVSRASHRAAPVDEVMRMVDRHRTRHEGWNVRHFHSFYRRDGGTRNYSWVRNKLQECGAVPKGKGRGRRRRRREPAPWPGMMLHQDGGTHERVAGAEWDLIVTMYDATNERHSMFFCEGEGAMSCFPGGWGGH